MFTEGAGAMTESRKLAAILVSDVVGYSRLAGADEDRTLARLRGLRSDLIDPAIAAHHGRIVKRTGDGSIVEFRSVVDAVRCAIEVQNAMVERNAGVPEDRRIVFRIGIHLGDVVEESDGDLMGDGINIAARLQSIAAPGAICLSEDAYRQVKARLDLAVNDLGPTQLKNIAEPIGAYSVEVGIAAPPKRSAPAEPNAGEKHSIGLTQPDKPSIAVLPFQNMSGDPEQEYFADGISEEIITGLSKLRWFFVIARNSSFRYRGKRIDVKRIARELGVRYVLEGSVRKGGDRVRVTAQLIDAATGNHLWADHFDGDLTDVFALQDEITKKVVGAIEPRLLEAESLRSQDRSPKDIDAWDMVMRANSLFWRLTNTESEAAIEILKRAVELHPDYAPARSMLAFMLLMTRWAVRTSSEFEPEVKEAAKLAARAIQLDDSDPWAHLVLGSVAFTQRQTNEAVDEYRRALELNPNFAAARGYLGLALALDGRSDAAIENIEHAMRMSPRDPQNSLFNTALAAAHYQAGRYTEAVGFARRASQQREGLMAGNRILIASLAQAGQIDEARAALQRLREMHPNISIAWIEKYVPYTAGPMAKFVEGMRKAGVPEE
jgi:TolB-like protein/class 3 adenylate cyclase/Tfp pilus assembly protein PilF